MEKKMIGQIEGVKFYEIHTARLIRRSIIKNLMLPFNLIRGIQDAKKIIKKEKPDIIFSKGGFVTVPVMLAAKKYKIPLLCHESDYTLGLANKIVSKYAIETFTSFKATAKTLKRGKYSGPIIKKEILMRTKEDAINNLQITTNKPILLITGGSLGAKKINDTIFSILPELTEKYYVCHIIGKTKDSGFKDPNYRAVNFASNMEDYIAASSVVISRAGSNTIFELAVKEKPMLLIPLGKSASRGDQLENARVFLNNGLARVLDEDNLSPSLLLSEIDETYKNSALLKKALQNAHINNGCEIIKSEILRQLRL